MRPRGSARELQVRREDVIHLLQEGVSARQVAKRVGVDRRSVGRWWRAYQIEGAKGLRSRPTSGRPHKLRLEKLEGFLAKFLESERSRWLLSDLWTFADLLEGEFKVCYHPDHLRRLLTSLGWGRRCYDFTDENGEHVFHQIWAPLGVTQVGGGGRLVTLEEDYPDEEDNKFEDSNRFPRR